MIVDRYDPMNLFDLLPKLQLELEPELAELDRLLEDDLLFQQVRADLARRYPQSRTRGRHSTPVEVILRMLVVRRLYDWSYEETEQFVSDSLILRQFCRLYLEPAPDDTTLLRWAALIGPQTLERLNQQVVALARRLKVTRGRKLRTDGTVVETTIHHPTDGALLSDGVRVLSRVLRQAKAVLGPTLQDADTLFRDRTRSAKRWAWRISDAARRAGEAGERAKRGAYQQLIQIAAASVRQASTVRERLGPPALHPVNRAEKAVERVVRAIERFLPLVQQVIVQSRRRVLHGEKVPAAEKVLSLFEPHTYTIRRNKYSRETEFGQKIWLDESDGGIVSNYRVLRGNPTDATQVKPSLAAHQTVFGRAPHLYTGDRGLYSPDNEALAEQMGVKRVVLPKPGYKSPERERVERQPWFRRGQRFRAGIEGRISVLQRRGWLGRCRDHGEAGFGRWIGWGILTANLTMIARTVSARG